MDNQYLPVINQQVQAQPEPGKTGMNPIMKIGLIGGAFFLLYKLSEKFTLGDNLNVTILSPRVHKVGLNGVEFRCEVKLQNPTNGTVKLSQPFVKLLSGKSVIASSPVVDKTIEIKARSEAVSDTISLQISWIDFMSTVKKILPGTEVSDVIADQSILEKLNLSIEYSVYINGNVLVRDSQALSGLENLEHIQGLGLVASGPRKIKSGREYDYLFPRPDFVDTIENRNGSITDTVKLLGNTVSRYMADTAKLAPMLRGNTMRETCENIWNFVYNHIQYKLDKPGEEQLRRPARSWAERKVGLDCDCMTIFISTILANLGIDHVIRITKYGGKNHYQHVYPIVPTGDGHITIDCVLSQFDYEKPFSQNKDHTMSQLGIPIAVLHGLGDIDEMSGVEDFMNLADIFDDQMHGLNGADEFDDEAVFDYLLKTRDIIINNPDRIASVDDPTGFLQMLEYAIEYWDTDKRDKALDILAVNEAQINKLNGVTIDDLDGLNDPDDYLHGIDSVDGFDAVDNDNLPFNGIGDFDGLAGRKKRQKRRKEKRSGMNKERKERKKKNKEERKQTKGFFRKLKVAAKQGGDQFLRYNPVSIAGRNGFLLALKINLHKMADRLKWGYLTKEAAMSKGFTEQDWNNSRKALQEIENMFVTKLRGSTIALRDAVLHGKRADFLNGFGASDEVYGFELLGEMALLGELGQLGSLGADPIIAASITAATPIILLAIKSMSKNKTKAEPDEEPDSTPSTAPDDSGSDDEGGDDETDGIYGLEGFAGIDDYDVRGTLGNILADAREDHESFKCLMNGIGEGEESEDTSTVDSFSDDDLINDAAWKDIWAKFSKKRKSESRKEWLKRRRALKSRRNKLVEPLKAANKKKKKEEAAKKEKKRKKRKKRKKLQDKKDSSEETPSSDESKSSDDSSESSSRESSDDSKSENIKKWGSTFKNHADDLYNLFVKKKPKKQKQSKDFNPSDSGGDEGGGSGNGHGGGAGKGILNFVKDNPIVTTVAVAGLAYAFIPPVRNFVNGIFIKKKPVTEAIPKVPIVSAPMPASPLLSGVRKRIKHHKSVKSITLK